MNRKPSTGIKEVSERGNRLGVLDRLHRYRRVDQEEIVWQLARWYSGKRGKQTLALLNTLMRQWLRSDDDSLVLEISGFPGHAEWVDHDRRGSVFCVAPAGGDARVDLDFLPVKTESSDLIIACHVLEFAEDPHRFLREIERMLAPRGRCIIVTFNWFGPTGLVRPLRLFRGVPWCGRFYPPWLLDNWLSILGFSIRKRAWLSPPLAVRGDRLWKKRMNCVLEKTLFWMGRLYAVYVQKQVPGMILSGRELGHQDFIRGRVMQPTAFDRH